MENQTFSFWYDDARNNFTSHTFDESVIYGGYLHDKNNREVLGILYNLVCILEGSKEIYVEHKEVTNERENLMCNYTVRLIKQNVDSTGEMIQFSNIKFIVNGE